MNTRFDGIRLKLQRSYDHLHSLNTIVDDFMRRNPYRIITETDAKGIYHKVWFIEAEPIPAQWSVLLGDLLYNLRSTLDHVVWQLVLANGNEPTSRNEFPVALTESQFNSRGLDQLTGVADDAVAVIRALQPYVVPDEAHRPRHVLWVIGKLGNIDKHRFLHVINTAVLPSGQITFNKPVPASNITLYPVGDLKHRTKLAEFTTDQPDFEVDVNSALLANIQIEKTEETPRIPWSFVTAMGDVVQRAAFLLEPMVKREPH